MNKMFASLQNNFESYNLRSESCSFAVLKSSTNDIVKQEYITYGRWEQTEHGINVFINFIFDRFVNIKF